MKQNNPLRQVLTLALLLLVCSTAQAQQTWSLKNNLLYDATLTPNLGIEGKVGKRSTLQLFYGLNPWKFSETKKLRHWSLMPEYRYWLSDKGPFGGWFTGVHALGGEFNVGGDVWPISFVKTLKENRYEGWFIGGGLTIGHAWRLSDHWNLEAALGIGYIRFKYDKYANEWCGPLLESKPYNYVGPTKLALNIAYVFGKQPEPIIVELEPELVPMPVVEPYKPDYHLAYLEPKAEQEKARNLKGQAYLDFVVNKTDIRRDYRRNAEELRKVEETINVVRQDPNITITHIGIHGYASPEGNYASNARLAEGRAQAFKDYVQQLIDVTAQLFSVESTPEDWEGLERALENQGGWLNDSSVAKIRVPVPMILIVKSDAKPDEKERQLKTRYPALWKQLLTDVFPALRHSDYMVSYTIRPFTIDEAKEMIRQKPQQLSLNEMFLVANTYTPGSQDFNEVFETAVRMYPDEGSYL